MIYQRILVLILWIAVLNPDAATAAQTNGRSAAGSGARPATAPLPGTASPAVTGSAPVAQLPQAVGSMPIPPGSELTLQRAVTIALPIIRA